MFKFFKFLYPESTIKNNFTIEESNIYTEDKQYFFTKKHMKCNTCGEYIEEQFPNEVCPDCGNKLYKHNTFRLVVLLLLTPVIIILGIFISIFSIAGEDA